MRSSNPDEGRGTSDLATPNVKLYVVVACIAALVLVAIVQVEFILYCPKFTLVLWFLSMQKLTLSLGELHYFQNESTRVLGAQGDHFA